MDATILLDHFVVKAVINTGSAGGLKENLHIGDIIISTKVHYHDVDLTAFGCKPGQLLNTPTVFKANLNLIQQALKSGQSFGLPVFSGAICTGDTFISRPQELEIVRKRFPEALACEMEAGAIAHTYHILSVRL
ncbi:5'-methylthioadenosine/S-adenosylhomocysteine nucleosidase [Bacteroidetes bacterium endosymbiont of Geopemphigus sp.]|uniref:5'-methylthioadenosine/S-adenosylhomocysteine nucleosidase n=1 Tax=Bacteroidetes bacterium endosymbiont of Geopemphigus sp. TaxID=2047937 RepID=UPI000CD1F366